MAATDRPRAQLHVQWDGTSQGANAVTLVRNSAGTTHGVTISFTVDDDGKDLVDVTMPPDVDSQHPCLIVFDKPFKPATGPWAFDQAPGADPHDASKAITLSPQSPVMSAELLTNENGEQTALAVIDNNVASSAPPDTYLYTLHLVSSDGQRRIDYDPKIVNRHTPV